MHTTFNRRTNQNWQEKNGTGMKGYFKIYYDIIKMFDLLTLRWRSSVWRPSVAARSPAPGSGTPPTCSVPPPLPDLV